jgi:hypothetical protein
MQPMPTDGEPTSSGLALDDVRQPICLSCAGIPGDFTCRRCGTEGDFYRRATCARCALRDDLTASMIDGAHDPTAMTRIVDALCRVDRPASILTWKLSLKIQALLGGLASGDIPLTHQGLDDAGKDEETAICVVSSNTTASWPPETNLWPGSSGGSQ